MACYTVLQESFNTFTVSTDGEMGKVMNNLTVALIMDVGPILSFKKYELIYFKHIT